MDPVSLFELATSQSKWLSARQSAVASNIANINYTRLPHEGCRCLRQTAELTAGFNGGNQSRASGCRIRWL